MSSEPDLATRYRHELAEALRATGPDAATLCSGWTTRDLAAHLVVRESPRWNLPTHHDERALAETKRRPFEDLVNEFAGGPPRWSPFGLPGVDKLVNGIEYAVHLVDVARANPELSAEYEGSLAALWRHWQMPLMARNSLRAAPVPFSVDTGVGPALIIKAGVPRAVLHASVADVLLLVSGRSRYAQWTVGGSPQLAHTLDYWLEQRKRANALENPDRQPD